MVNRYTLSVGDMESWFMKPIHLYSCSSIWGDVSVWVLCIFNVPSKSPCWGNFWIPINLPKMVSNCIYLQLNWPLFFGRLTFHFMGQTFQNMGHLGSRYAWRIGRFRRLKWVAVFTCNNEFTTGEFQKRDHLCEPSPSWCVFTWETYYGNWNQI